MRFYLRILLVLGLAVAMIAAVIAWERFYLSPLIEGTQAKPDPVDTATEELPAECVEELSRESSSASDRASVAETEAGDAQRLQGSGLRHAATQIQVVDAAPATIESDAAARPIQQAQSADWLASAVDSPTGKRPAARVSPASAEQVMRQHESDEAVKSVDALDLMRRLRADDGQQRDESRRELLRRGFSEVDLELARQLFSPDVETRKQLARAVPRLSSIDAARWLMWLALDPQPEVRLAAISTLATTGDPALLERVEALARNDRDPQIQALADRIAKQRDLAGSRGDAPAGSRFSP